MINVELLEKVLTHVEERPTQLDMSSWVTGLIPEGVQPGETLCGAVCCIAGWAVLFTPGNQPILDSQHRIRGMVLADGKRMGSMDSPEWLVAGAATLGLTIDQATDIFYKTFYLKEDCEEWGEHAAQYEQESNGLPYEGPCDHAHYDSVLDFTNEIRRELGLPEKIVVPA